MPVKGIVTINGVKYPIENFEVTWTNPINPVYINGSNTFYFPDPFKETAEQIDKRLNPRKYDTCHFCDHYRFRHELGYQKCTGTDIDYEYDYKSENRCECQQFV